jgi:hypothetical protein
MSARRRPVPAAVAAALLMTLTACGGDDGGEPDAEPNDDTSASSSPSPSATEADAEETAEPVEETFPLPKPPKAADTPAAREAFAEFVVARWGYALATNEPGAVTDLSPEGAPCKGCSDLEKELTNRSKEGWNVDFPGAEVNKVTVEPAGPPRTFDAVATIDIPESQSYFEDGSFRNDNKAFDDAEFTVQMRWTGNRYLLLSYSLS